RTFLGPDHGFLPDAALCGAPPTGFKKPRHMYLWEIKDATARLTNPLGDKDVIIPIRPFLGCIGTAPPGEPLSTLLAGTHGGNIDHSDLAAGTSLCLPVSLAGGLLYLGDMHAAQGHGETAGGGLEISGSATIRVTLHKSLALRAPRYQTPDGNACLAVGSDIPSAMQQALAGMIGWLTSAGWNHWDANMLASQTCEFRFGGIGKTYAVVSCFIAKDKLSGDPLSWGY
ncbi:MAG TPA: acetamidase/formamidase family protein, partial [Terrimicrobiaceae bacterium]|nr:acetamidase/formamidase family protein [Terrimicrobiaceae bacterium]